MDPRSSGTSEFTCVAPMNAVADSTARNPIAHITIAGRTTGRQNPRSATTTAPTTTAEAAVDCEGNGTVAAAAAPRRPATQNQLPTCRSMSPARTTNAANALFAFTYPKGPARGRVLKSPSGVATATATAEPSTTSGMIHRRTVETSRAATTTA